MHVTARLAIVSTMLALGTVVATSRPADAQVLGYGIVGPSGYSGFFGSSVTAGHVAGGGEVLAARRVGAGGEFGLIAGPGGGLWVTSANAVYHFVPSGRPAADARVSPFVTGGYTRMRSGEGGFDGWNAGAGADIWLKPRVGLRLEFRDHVRPDSRGTVYYWSFRAGIAFR
jgi:hypothetical protein